MEKSQTKYRLEFGLARMCLVKITTSLWNRQDVRNKIRFLHEQERQAVNRFIGYRIFERSIPLQCRVELIKEVICLFDKVGLPKLMRGEFILVIKSIGFKIFEWIKYVTQELEFSYAVAEQICWTSYGTVDKVATFKLWLCNNKDLDVVKLYNIACNLCLQEHIRDLWKEIPSSVQRTYFRQHGQCESFNFHSYWKCYRENTLSMTTRTSNMYRNSLCDLRYDESMFSFSIIEKNEVAARYFSTRLNKEQREKCLKNILMNGIDGRYDIYENFCYESLNEITAITGILLSELDFDSCNSYSRINVRFLLQLLLHWPCQQFLVLVLGKIWQHFDVLDYQHLIHDITQLIGQDLDLCSDLKQSIYRTILHEVWGKSPAHFKGCVNDCLDIQVLPMLLLIGDTASLNMIINDKDFGSKRQDLLYQWKDLFLKYLCEGKFELIETFANGVLKEEERSTYVRTCMYQIKFSYLVQQHFLDLSCKDFSIAKIKFENLFTLCSLSEEEINILKRCIIVQDLANTWCGDMIFNNDGLEQVNDFLSWCSLSTEEIERVKTKVKCGWKWYQFNLICSIHPNTATNFFEWCFEKKYENQEFIQQFILASYDSEESKKCIICEGLRVLSKSEDQLETFKTFANIWLVTPEIQNEFGEKFESDLKSGKIEINKQGYEEIMYSIKKKMNRRLTHIV